MQLFNASCYCHRAALLATSGCPVNQPFQHNQAHSSQILIARLFFDAYARLSSTLLWTNFLLPTRHVWFPVIVPAFCSQPWDFVLHPWLLSCLWLLGITYYDATLWVSVSAYLWSKVSPHLALYVHHVKTHLLIFWSLAWYRTELCVCFDWCHCSLTCFRAWIACCISRYASDFVKRLWWYIELCCSYHLPCTCWVLALDISANSFWYPANCNWVPTQPVTVILVFESCCTGSLYDSKG